MLSWLDAREETLFGNHLAEYYDREVKKIDSRYTRKHKDKQGKLLASIINQARQYRLSHKLNIYKKAKLGNAFKWKLSDLGYDQEFIDILAKEVLLALS